MNKRHIPTLFGLSLSLPVLSISVLANSNYQKRNVISTPISNYTLLLNGSNSFIDSDAPNNSLLSGVVKTSLGNDISFNYLKGYKTSDEFITLDNEGTFTNTTPISGISSVSISANKDITLRYDDVDIIISNNDETYISSDYFSLISTSDSTSITSITIKYTCSSESIYSYTLDGDDYLLTSISNKALTSYNIPTKHLGKNVIMDQGIFEGCNNVTSINIPNLNNHPLGYFFKTGTISSNSATLASYLPSSLTRVTIKEGSIPNNALRNVSNVSSVILLDVTSIGENTFNTMYSLNEVYLNDGLSTINRYAFNNCPALMDIFIPISVTTMGASIFQSNHKDITIRCEAIEQPETGWNASWFGSYESHVSWGESR